MSYGWMAYAVDLARADAVYGCRDEALLAAVTTTLADDLQQSDAWLTAELRAGAPPAAEALRRVIAGEPVVGHGAQYAYAYERICRYLGKPLDNAQFSPCSTDRLRELDAVFAKHAVPLSLAALQYGKRPAWLPAPDDFPAMGRLTTMEALNARKAMNGHVRNRIMDTESEATYEAIEEVFAWLVAAIEGGGLALFYY